MSRLIALFSQHYKPRREVIAENDAVAVDGSDDFDSVDTMEVDVVDKRFEQDMLYFRYEFLTDIRTPVRDSSNKIVSWLYFGGAERHEDIDILNFTPNTDRECHGRTEHQRDVGAASCFVCI